AVDAVTRLTSQGFMWCGTGFNPGRDGGVSTFGPFCNYNHPLILPLLREYLPAPAMLTVNQTDGGSVVLTDPAVIEPTFYGALMTYRNSIDQARWDAAAFSTALSTRIIAPAQHADQVLSAWPYLTRMFTTISPVEMTADPEFWEHDGLGNVNVSGSAQRRITCTNASGMTLPDGRQVALTPQSMWPGFTADMPFAERIEEFTTTSGPPIVLVDNTQKINATLKAWNDSQRWPPPPDTTVGGTVGAGGAPPSGGGAVNTGGSTVTGVD